MDKIEGEIDREMVEVVVVREGREELEVEEAEAEEVMEVVRWFEGRLFKLLLVDDVCIDEKY